MKGVSVGMCHRRGRLGRGGLCVEGEDIYAGVADTEEQASQLREPCDGQRQPLAPCCYTMKILFGDILLLSLLSSVFSSCPRDCLTCQEKLHPGPESFNLKVCILQCEEKVFPRLLWTACTKAMASGSGQLDPADPDLVSAALYQPKASEMQHLKRMPRVRSLAQARETEPGAEDAEEVEQKQLQKRFGGFTGARKSARKLANQKRFSEFMRQYLVLSMQSSQRRRTLHQNGIRVIPRTACVHPQTCRPGARSPSFPRH
ncbi:prepronociceptin isoform X2 [Meriones unguiculatus]|uniref:prepronociceptin isoform X2 n=2 Tax=Meriones unguiculatus TaxID=10047 RepID=UPI00293E2101|nr:prepronociceptin isoform X2 [Meriones unguiculatus]